MSKRLTKHDDISYGVVYMPPEYSDFSVVDPFAEIQAELNVFSDKFSSICLFGDWNARTKTLKDYFDVDYDMFHEIDLDDLYYEFQQEINTFDKGKP